PHVRMITEMAVSMGKVVCTQDVEAARQRDEGMLSQPEEARMNGMLTLEGIRTGILAGGGAIFPDPGHGATRLDDAAGYAALLLTREEGEAARAFAEAGGFTVLCRELPDPDGYLAKLLGDAPGILVRPDRYVFGIGDP